MVAIPDSTWKVVATNANPAAKRRRGRHGQQKRRLPQPENETRLIRPTTRNKRLSPHAERPLVAVQRRSQARIFCPRPAAQGRHVPSLPTSGRRAEAPPLRSLPPARSCHGGRSRLCEPLVAAARSLRRLSSPRPSVGPLRGLPQAAGSASRLHERATCCSSTVSARPAPASRPHSGFSVLRSGASALALSGSSAPSRVVPGQPGGGIPNRDRLPVYRSTPVAPSPATAPDAPARPPGAAETVTARQHPRRRPYPQPSP